MSKKPTVKLQDAINTLLVALKTTEKRQNNTNQIISDLNKGIQDLLKHKLKLDDSELKTSNAELLNQLKAIETRSKKTFNQQFKQVDEMFEYRSQQIKEQIEVRKDRKDNFINYTLIAFGVCIISIGFVMNSQLKIGKYKREVNNLNTENKLYMQYLADNELEENFMRYMDKD